MIDSAIFGHQWVTAGSLSIFSEQQRVHRWVTVIAALARAQAALGIIPRGAADEISTLVHRDVDLDAVAEQTRMTSHSTLGLIRVLQTMLSEESQEHVYVGATVQDITDTAMVLEMREVGEQVWAGLVRIEERLCAIAEEHAATPMVGRTHGQPGAPITFGFKVASWADEVGRSVERLDQLRKRVLVCQLGGAVGSLAFFGSDAMRLRSAFADEVGLGHPTVSWLTARDRLAEFASVLGLATTGLARIANEVYSLQRSEIGEVREASNHSVVGSITMPHKRNPESSEQIVVLARLVRSHAAVLADTMLQEHERDARGWKAEWAVFPELCHYTCAATSMSISLVDGLVVDTERMSENLAGSATTNSERLLKSLAPRLGKHRAQELLHRAFLQQPGDLDLTAAVRALLPSDLADVDLPLWEAPDAGACTEMVEQVVDASRSRRSAEPARWS